MIITKLLGLSSFLANKKMTIAILAVEIGILAYAISQEKDQKKKRKLKKKLKKNKEIELPRKTQLASS